MSKQPLHYTLTPADPAGHYFELALLVREPNPEGQLLRLPAWIPGSYMIRDFSRHIIGLEAFCGKQRISTRKLDNHTWQCDPCKGELRIHYKVYAWDLSVRGAHFDETHAFFNGTSVYLLPVGHEQTACLVQLAPPPHNKNWKVYTSLPEAKGHRGAARRHGFGLYLAPDYDALIDHPVEMGTPQHIEFDVAGTPHEMVFTGVAPNIDLKRIAADTQKICEAQVALFEPETRQTPFADSASRYVFMTMLTGNDYGGLEHRASTALMIGRHTLPVLGQDEAGNDYQDFLGLVSHEYFHSWNVKRIKPAAFAPYQLFTENHSRLLWVFEGFTSYYDDLMLVRSGVISYTDYLKKLASTISLVYRNPGRLKQSVAESSFNAWTGLYKSDENSPNAIVSYYSKGSLVALGLDLLIRQQSGQTRSLDDVMRLMWARYGKAFYQEGTNKGVAEDEMPALIVEATGVDTSDYLTRYAYGSEDIPLEALFASQNIELEWETPSQIVSLDARTTQGPDGLKLATVYNGGAAHKAGLSGGDVLVAINGLRVETPASLERVLKTCLPGVAIDVHVFRRDELRQFVLHPSAPALSECRLRTSRPSDSGQASQ